jgi:hypothetical protein
MPIRNTTINNVEKRIRYENGGSNVVPLPEKPGNPQWYDDEYYKKKVAQDTQVKSKPKEYLKTMPEIDPRDLSPEGILSVLKNNKALQVDFGNRYDRDFYMGVLGQYFGVKELEQKSLMQLEEMLQDLIGQGVI